MKKSTLSIVLATALLGMTAAQASEFDGGWIGGKIGNNSSDATGLNTKNAATYGLEGGYNWNMGGFLLGVDGFADSNSKATHVLPLTTYGSSVYGLDAKLGLPSGNWLPYAKIGYARTNGNNGASAISSGDAHLGLGVEYKFAPHWSVAGEYTNASAKSNGNKLNNNNLTLGINYYFDEPYVAPAIVAAVAPVVVKAVEPKPAPAPVYKTIFSDKPVILEGANFDTNSAKLKPTADARLSEVIDFAEKHQTTDLAVSGHTDSRGSEKLNQKLSTARAESVKAYLVKKGVPADRITTQGEASTRPIGDNKTKQGRAQNRRVEINAVLKEEKKVLVQ